MLHPAAGNQPQPSAAILNSPTLRSSSMCVTRAAYDGAKRKKGFKLRLALDPLGHLLTLHVTPANAGDLGEVEHLAKVVQASTEHSVEPAYVDQFYSQSQAALAAKAQDIDFEVVTPHEAKRSLILLPRRRVVERSFA